RCHLGGVPHGGARLSGPGRTGTLRAHGHGPSRPLDLQRRPHGTAAGGAHRRGRAPLPAGRRRYSPGAHRSARRRGGGPTGVIVPPVPVPLAEAGPDVTRGPRRPSPTTGERHHLVKPRTCHTTPV